MGNMRALFALVLGLMVALSAPAPAYALSARQATAKALAALQPQRQKGRVVVYTLRRPLGASQVVTVADPRNPARLRIKRPNRRRWFFWMDLLNGALFAHPSVAVTIDDRTGRVLERNRLLWYPLIDGRAPPYLRSPKAAKDRRWQVFSNLRKAKQARARAAAVPGSFKPGGNNGPFAVPKSRFAKDCLIEIGDRDEMFRGSYRAIESFADDVGIRRTRATPSASGLRRAVRSAIAGTGDKEPCNDVFIYLAGHGMPPPDQGGGAAQVVVKPRYDVEGNVLLNRSRTITPKDIADILDRYPAVDFKIKVMSCFSGRFVPPLEGKKNLRVIETSSSATSESVFDVDGAIDEDGKDYPDTSENPTGADEFTNGNVHGLYDWARDQAFETANGAANGLARGIEESFTRGASQDFGRTVLETDPQLKVNRAPVMTPTPMPAPVSSVFQGFGMFAFFDATEVVGTGWYFDVVARGGSLGARFAQSSSPVTEIRIAFPPAGSTPRVVTNQLCPSKLPTVGIVATVTAGDTLTCSGGTLALGERFNVNVRTLPVPSAGMGAKLYGVRDGAVAGPFTITGP